MEGFDFTLDETLHVWLLEINHRPGMRLIRHLAVLLRLAPEVAEGLEG